MKKSLLLFFLFLVTQVVNPPKIHAQSPPFKGTECGFQVTCTDPSCKLGSNVNEIIFGAQKVNFIFDLSQIPSGFWSTVPLDFFNRDLITHPDDNFLCNINHPHQTKTSIITDTRTKLFENCRDLFTEGSHTYSLQYLNNNNKAIDLCIGQYSIIPQLDADITITSTTGKQDIDSPWDVEIKNVIINKSHDNQEHSPYEPFFSTHLDGEYLNNNYTGNFIEKRVNLGPLFNTAGETVHFTLKSLPPGTHTVSIRILGTPITIQAASFTVVGRGTPIPTLTPINTPTPTLIPGAPTYTPPPPAPSLAPICEQIDGHFFAACDKCVNKEHGIWSAIGCIPTDIETLLKDYLFPYGAGIGGGTSFLYFIYGVFVILTSAGNAEKIAEAKEIIISALSGLLLIIFSVFLLRVIGVDILRLPGFT